MTVWNVDKNAEAKTMVITAEFKTSITNVWQLWGLLVPAARSVDDVEQAPSHDHRPRPLRRLAQHLRVDGVVARYGPGVQRLRVASQAPRRAGSRR